MKRFVFLFLFISSMAAAQDAVLKGKVFDCKYQFALDSVAVILKEQGREVQRCFTSLYGTYLLTGIPGKTYTVEAVVPESTDKSCFPGMQYLKTPQTFVWLPMNTDVTQRNFCFTPVEAEMRLPVVLFDRNTANISAKQDAELDPVKLMVCFLNENPSVILEIGGHADASEKTDKTKTTDSDPVLLSEWRAKKAADLLINDHHIDKNRLRVLGYGSSRPAVLPDGSKTDPKSLAKLPAARRDSLIALNCRVVFRIIGWDFPVKDESAPEKKRIRYDAPDQGVFLCGKISDAVFAFPLNDVKLDFITGSNGSFSVKTDQFGYYSVWLYRGTKYQLRNIDASLAVTDTSRAWESPYLPCSSYLVMNADTISGEIIRRNFGMKCMPVCTIHFPEISFRENSVSESPIVASENISSLVLMLKDNPSSSVRLGAHYNPSVPGSEKLARERIRYITKKLRRQRISKKRVSSSVTTEQSGRGLVYYYRQLHPPCEPKLSKEEEAVVAEKLKNTVEVRVSIFKPALLR